MKHLLYILPCLLLLPFANAQTFSPGQVGGTSLAERFSIDAGLWYTTGEAEWTETGGSGDGAFIDSYRSLLEYNKLDAPMFLVEGEAAITERIRVGARYATGSMDDAEGADNDWLDGPGLGREFFVSRSENDLDGDTQLIELELLYRLPQQQKEGLTLDVFGTIGRYTDEFTSSNGRQTLVDETPVNETFAGLGSTYDFEWTTLTIGLKGDWQSPTSGWNVEGRLGVMPWVDYEGEAFWNLRTDFKRTPPNFVHEADGGFGFEGRVGVGYDWDRFNGKIGYWYRSLDVDGGVSETFFVDGSSGFANLEAKSVRHGIYGTVGFEF